MSDFIDHEAEVSDEDDLPSDHENTDTNVDFKKRQRVLDSSEEEEEDEDEAIVAEELKDLINDDIEEEAEESDSDETESRLTRKRPATGSGDAGDGKSAVDDSDDDEDDDDDDLSDDDYALIKDNLGLEMRRQKKRRRIRAGSSDEDEPKEREQLRDVLADELFDEDEDGVNGGVGGGGERAGAGTRFRSDSGRDGAVSADGSSSSLGPGAAGGGLSQPNDGPSASSDLALPLVDESLRIDPDEDDEEEVNDDDSDMGDFIVDESGESIARQGPRRRAIHTDQALEAAQGIFGVDFDFNEFQEFDEDDISEYDGSEYDVTEEGEQIRRQKPRKSTKYNLAEIYEPRDIERGHLTEKDNVIRNQDKPERFQLREVPVEAADPEELEEESEWIYRTAFCASTLSTQEVPEPQGPDLPGAPASGSGVIKTKPPSTIDKIRKALDFMRNQLLEVPFIVHYRKEYVLPELTVDDLWKVWQFDEKFMHLKRRRENLGRLFERMQAYQFAVYSEADKEFPLGVRPLVEIDIIRVQSVQTVEDLNDMYQHFLLYYGPEISAMKAYEKAQRAQEDAPASEDQQTAPKDDDEEVLKRAPRRGGYDLCLRHGIAEVAELYGLGSSEFGENIRDTYLVHPVSQTPTIQKPIDFALTFIHHKFAQYREMNKEYPFRTAEDVLSAARHMVAVKIAYEPLVRQTIRSVFFERATINVTPTKSGIKEIDESHPCFTCKYIKNKPVTDLNHDDFVKLVQAEEDSLLKIDLIIDRADSETSYIDEIKPLFHSEFKSKASQLWNDERSQALEKALQTILYPLFAKELRQKLLKEAKDGIILQCCRNLRNRLRIAPYSSAQQETLDAAEDDEEKQGVRVLGLAFSMEMDQASFCAMLDGNGTVIDFLKLTCFTRKRPTIEILQRAREADLSNLTRFLLDKRPNVIAVGSETRDALGIITELEALVKGLEEEHSIPPIGVELVDNRPALVYMNSNVANLEPEFKQYPPLLKQAVSLARRLQDPLLEFSQLVNADDDIMCLTYHPLQDCLDKDALRKELLQEFVNKVNEVGVDFNYCIKYPHTAGVAQFLCGLGPRKAAFVLKWLKQRQKRLENRAQLVTDFKMNQKVFINCAGFIKIDSNTEINTVDSFQEPLDSTRVHPEAYEWARKMAIDALEIEDTENNPTAAVEEIFESPDRLKDLDLDAFANELKRQGYGDKHITLYDIRGELSHRYKDVRDQYVSPNAIERFTYITGESPETFYVGRLIQAQVIGIIRRQPDGEALDQANPTKNQTTGMWECPFCGKDDFPELAEVWSHFDQSSCQGKAIGVRCRLDNGVSGFIPTRSISDKQVVNPEERVKIGMTLHCRITKIDIERFRCDLTSKTSDLRDESQEVMWRPTKDVYYDFDAEAAGKEKDEDEKKKKRLQKYIKRVIAHPQFKNIGYQECEHLLLDADMGDVIVRPSSKGADHLTLSWKVDNGIVQHIDIIEQGKENAFSIGKRLVIGDEEFEDLDEIIARFIQPMATYVRDIMAYKYYFDSSAGDKEAIAEHLAEEKRKLSTRIPYTFSSTRQYPGKFLLSYMPKTKAVHEYVSVTNEGYRYRGQHLSSLSELIKFFKDNYMQAAPGSLRRAAGDGAAVGAVSGQDDGGVVAEPEFITAPYTPIGGGLGGMTPFTPMYQPPQMTPGPPPPNFMPAAAATGTFPHQQQMMDMDNTGGGTGPPPQSFLPPPQAPIWDAPPGPGGSMGNLPPPPSWMGGPVEPSNQFNSNNYPPDQTSENDFSNQYNEGDRRGGQSGNYRDSPTYGRSGRPQQQQQRRHGRDRYDDERRSSYNDSSHSDNNRNNFSRQSDRQERRQNSGHTRRYNNEQENYFEEEVHNSGQDNDYNQSAVEEFGVPSEYGIPAEFGLPTEFGGPSRAERRHSGEGRSEGFDRRSRGRGRGSRDYNRSYRDGGRGRGRNAHSYSHHHQQSAHDYRSPPQYAY